MSLKSLENDLTDTELDIVWCHWNRLGAMGYGKKNHCSTDPEALIILTSLVGHKDPRLVEIMMAWLDKYESLVSVERLKRYVKDLQLKNIGCRNAFDILREIITKLDLKRWQSVFHLLGDKVSNNYSTHQTYITEKKLETHDKIIHNNLQLSLRLMFGVGTRADMIYYATVVANQDKDPFSLLISAPHMSSALHYNNSSIHRTLCDLERSCILSEDRKKKMGKNKVYILNTDFSSKSIKRDKCYVDWFNIVQLFMLVEQLKEQVCDIKGESIIKSRLNDFLNLSSGLVNQAYVDIKNTLSQRALQPALKMVKLGDLESGVISLFSDVHEFITSEGWL